MQATATRQPEIIPGRLLCWWRHTRGGARWLPRGTRYSYFLNDLPIPESSRAANGLLYHLTRIPPAVDDLPLFSSSERKKLLNIPIFVPSLCPASLTYHQSYRRCEYREGTTLPRKTREMKCIGNGCCISTSTLQAYILIAQILTGSTGYFRSFPAVQVETCRTSVSTLQANGTLYRAST